MAKKITREAQYRELLKWDGVNFDDCRVLAFTFKKDTGPMIFHIALMRKKPIYYLFDAYGSTANVIVPKDDTNAQAICAIAEQSGGEKRVPNLRG